MRSPREALARGLYSLLLRLLQPAYALRLWLRGRAEPLYRERIGERFGFYREPRSTGWVWLHAVSLGEARAAQALVDALRVEWPAMRLLLTHGTATGFEAGRSLLREGDHQTWLPYDTPGATRRFIAQFRPAIGVLMETEVWPNLLLAAQAARVSMVLANARLSARSFARGQRINAVLRLAIDSVALVLAQTEDDARRIRASGARTVEVAGNLKYDLTPDAAQLAQGEAWRALLQRGVVLAAITREGEEALLLAAYMRVFDAQARQDTLLVLVPRHPQRFDAVAGEIERAGFRCARRSLGMTHIDTVDVLLGDSMGEMAAYYSFCDIAIIGGSFLPLGGQNLIEACALGKPVIMGPSTFNFAGTVQLARDAGAMLQVADAPEAMRVAHQLMRDDARRKNMSDSGFKLIDANRGATEKTLALIVSVLGEN